eukprot:10352167-Ditylum_brightwellii.AAC.1
MVRCMGLVKTFSDDIRMSFGMDKCAILTVVNSIPMETNILDDFPLLLHDDGCKYLRILENS